MKKIIQIVALTTCLTMGGVQIHLPPKFCNSEPSTRQSTRSSLSAPIEDLSRLANDTAYMIATHYIAQTNSIISMNIADGDVFGERLKKSLEAKGFSVYTGTEKTYQDVDLVYTLRYKSCS